MLAPSLKIERAQYAITVDARRRVIADATVVVDGGRITHVGKAEELRDVAAERTIDATGGVLTPAFVNGHMHISYAHAVRGLFPDDFVGRERLREVFRLQSAMTEEEEYWTSMLAVIELTRSGTLTFVDPGSTRYLDACLQVYAEAGCRVVTGTTVIDLDSDLAQDPEARRALARESRDDPQRVLREGLALSRRDSIPPEQPCESSRSRLRSAAPSTSTTALGAGSGSADRRGDPLARR